MRIALGSDHAGFELKEEMKAFLTKENHEVIDVGAHSKDPVDYPDYAEAIGAACANTGQSAASFSVAAVLARPWPQTGFPAFAQGCAMTPIRHTKAWSMIT
ncbi:MAG: ribose 5-phosphate isomerase B [Candidatus Brocadia fulgida]|uniref:Ribose 5-phosphate isomerase B n=1 Tax=Candidatus Brocadia fulgida TaxID=380242 RepID=A0A0M2UZX0_9BACT|nr:MAG: ribose 5-phosphate isomerase B [Candidatus Brocadia fulgida]